MISRTTSGGGRCAVKSFLKGLLDGSGSAVRNGVRGAAVVAVLLGECFAMRADLSRWVENLDATSRFERVFFRTVVLGTGSVPVRRPPKETRPELTKLIDSTPADAELYSLRALEAEQQLDFAAAEADWVAY